MAKHFGPQHAKNGYAAYSGKAKPRYKQAKPQQQKKK